MASRVRQKQLKSIIENVEIPVIMSVWMDLSSTIRSPLLISAFANTPSVPSVVPPRSPGAMLNFVAVDSNLAFSFVIALVLLVNCSAMIQGYPTRATLYCLLHSPTVLAVSSKALFQLFEAELHPH